jgi:DNA-binding beta-propeller fold protein YncE
MNSVGSTQSSKRPRAGRIAMVGPPVACAVILLVAILFPLPALADEARPTAVGDLAYITLAGSDLVALVDTASHTVIGSVDVGAAGCHWPRRLAISPAGDFVYVSCFDSENVAVIETAGNTIVTTVGVTNVPYGIAFTRDGAYALVGSLNDRQIAVIDTATYALSFIRTPDEPVNIVAHPYLDRAYATLPDAYTILVIDTTTFSILTAIPVGVRRWNVAVSPHGKWVFASSRWDEGVAVIDAVSNTLHTTLTGLGDVNGLEVAPDGSEVYACSPWDRVHVIDGVTFQHITTVPSVGYAWDAAVTCDGTELYVDTWSWEIPVIDTTTYSITARIPMPEWEVRGIAICPQHVASGLVLSPPAQTNSGARGQVVAHEGILFNATGASDSFSLTLGSHVWDTALSTEGLGPIANGDAATFTVYVTVPMGVDWYSTDMVVATATSVTSPTVYSDTAAFTTQAYAPPQISVSPAALTSVQVADQVVSETLLIGNGNGVTLTFELAELASPFATQVPSPADLAGKRILYDQAHDEHAPRHLSTLIGDAAGAGAEVNLNWTYPIDASVLEGYDVLWVNCCGDTSWTTDELNAVSDWLAEGGAVFVHGESSPATDGAASVYGISYQPASCASGHTGYITEHPISAGVTKLMVPVESCHSLATGGGADIVVYDPEGKPYVVAQEQGHGRMVVIANQGFLDYEIDWCDNRLLANNILAWLASPTYSDVPWLSETPESGIVLSQSSTPVTVAFDSTGLSLGEVQATLAVEYKDPVQPSPIEVPVTLTVVAEGAGLSLAPSLQKGKGPPGETVVYNLTVINLGSYTDTFTLEASGLWTPTLAVGSIGPLGVAERSAFTLEVAIPATAEAGSSDLATITARSASDPGVSSSAQITTTAQAPPRYLPLILKNSD